MYFCKILFDMKAMNINDRLVKTYLKLLTALSVEARLDIISQLSQSLKQPLKEKYSVDYFAGAWDDERSADEIIEEIRAGRTFTRQIEEF